MWVCLYFLSTFFMWSCWSYETGIFMKEKKDLPCRQMICVKKKCMCLQGESSSEGGQLTEQPWSHRSWNNSCGGCGKSDLLCKLSNFYLSEIHSVLWKNPLNHRLFLIIVQWMNIHVKLIHAALFPWSNFCNI